MAPILQSLESRCCVDHGIESLEIPEFGKVESDGGMIAVRLILHSLAKPSSAFPQTLMEPKPLWMAFPGPPGCCQSQRRYGQRRLFNGVGETFGCPPTSIVTLLIDQPLDGV